MASQGPLGAGGGSSIAGPDVDWSNPPNVVTEDDGNYAVASLLAFEASDPLQITNFPFSIPSGATINGIIAEIKRKQSAGIGTIEDANVHIVKGGSSAGLDHSIVGAWPSTNTYQTYGSSTDLWDTTWTPADINASNFGVRIAVFESGGTDSADASVDYGRMTVYYTLAGRSYAVSFLGA